MAGIVAASAAVRVRTAFADPGFDVEDPRGMLKSDPALLFYVTERIVEAGGWFPDDFRADPRVQHPGTTDLPAELTVGQELLAAWAALLVGDVPLHVVCTVLFAATASLALLFLFLLVRELSGSTAWALVALALAAVLPANYRTIGFVLVREDLSLPFWVLHLWLLARAARRPARGRYVLAGVALAAALATWHAMRFVVALEAGCVLLAALARGRNALASPHALAVLIGPLAAGVVVPALRHGGLLLSGAALLATPFAALALARARRLRPAASVAVALGALAAHALAASWLAPGGHRHVADVVVAKLAHLGRLPDDPAALSFDARLLWQGPFHTLEAGEALALLGWGLAAALSGVVVLAAVPRRRAPGDGLLVVATLVALGAAWMFGRLVVLPGLLAPACGAVLLSRLRQPAPALVALALVTLFQGTGFARFLGDHRIAWYLPPGRQAEIAALVSWVAEELDPDEPVLGDFVSSTAVLAHARNPIVLQPKYETERSRRRAEAFLVTLFQGSPEDLRELARERFRCEVVVFDRYTLGVLSRYAGGLPAGEPLRPGTAAAVFLSQDEAVLRSVPGFELVYRSPASIRQSDGTPYDLFRVYRIRE